MSKEQLEQAMKNNPEVRQAVATYQAGLRKDAAYFAVHAKLTEVFGAAVKANTGAGVEGIIATIKETGPQQGLTSEEINRAEARLRRTETLVTVLKKYGLDK